jgi:hypothetical protein
LEWIKEVPDYVSDARLPESDGPSWQSEGKG